MVQPGAWGTKSSRRRLSTSAPNKRSLAHAYPQTAVHSVNVESDSKVKAIHIETGGFLGIGGKLVAIPEGKYTRSGDNVQLGMTADAVSKLPEVEEQS